MDIQPSRCLTLVLSFCFQWAFYHLWTSDLAPTYFDHPWKTSWHIWHSFHCLLWSWSGPWKIFL